ncbi:MAG TPA: fumarylacetoacetate hydrolase family protein [Sedimentisphaerales bacterium]|nr:fumarylacetoacetate hydrolase family protein [Sedimentisphaerales bacterium]
MRHSRNPIVSGISVMVLLAVLVTSGCGPTWANRTSTDKMVEEMLAARHARRQIQYPTKTYGAFSIERAYRIQAELAEELSEELGPVVGYKVAYASKAAQEQFGVTEPAAGPFFSIQRVPNGSKLPARHFLEIALETEVAFTIGKRIDHAIKDVAEMKEYVRWAHAAFDAGDYPLVQGDTKPTAQDMIASGVGAHVFVLGPAVDPGKVDVDAVTLKLIRNGETVAESAATNVMGSPWNSLLWCANHVVKLGGTLEPGTVVSTGTASPAYKVKGDAIEGQYVGDCGPLGKVTMTLY